MSSKITEVVNFIQLVHANKYPALKFTPAQLVILAEFSCVHAHVSVKFPFKLESRFQILCSSWGSILTTNYKTSFYVMVKTPNFQKAKNLTLQPLPLMLLKKFSGEVLSSENFKNFTEGN